MTNYSHIPILGVVFALWVIAGSLIGQNQTGLQQDPSRAVVVLELFTSQGCSSCPSADILLKKVSDNPGRVPIYPIAYHVDYWNYIGWEDPYSKREFTDKQRTYAQKFGDNSIYTPQLVINGKEHLVGSDANRLYQRIENHGRVPAGNFITVERIERNSRSISVNFLTDGPTEGRSIRAVLLLDGRSTRVLKGENKGRNLENSHIALNEIQQPLGREQGKLSIHIPEWVQNGEGLHLILLTAEQNMDITGATKVKVPDSG